MGIFFLTWIPCSCDREPLVSWFPPSLFPCVPLVNCLWCLVMGYGFPFPSLPAREQATTRACKGRRGL